MNLITVLLGTTGALLIAAVVLAFGVMKKDTDQDEVAKLKEEIAALEAIDRLGSPETLNSTSFTLPPAPLPGTAASGTLPIANPGLAPDPTFEARSDAGHTAGEEADLLAAQIETEERRFREEQLRLENDRLKKDNTILKTEAGLAWQSKLATDDKLMARAKLIEEAMLVARVTQWDREHGFAVIEIEQPDSAAAGTVLAIRRQTGIYGQVTVDQMYPGSQATVNPIPNTFLGEEGVDVQPGDELILPPL